MVLRILAALPGLVALASLAQAQPVSAARPVEEAHATSVEDAARRATAAREAGHLVEATSLYRHAVELRPDWAEGWWFLGSLAYESDRHAECRDAFGRLLEANPEFGRAWALRGLCEFALRELDPAWKHLDRALRVGIADDDPIRRVVLYHQALLLVRAGEFEAAIAPLRQLVERPDPGPKLVDVCGLRLLRRAELPDETLASARELVRTAGRAESAALAGRREEAEEHFRRLVERYPRERHVHHAYGRFLAQGGAAEAIEAFRREAELYPDDVEAHVDFALNLLDHGRPEEAVRAAQTAVRLAPGVSATHMALGQGLLATGNLALGTSELESAARLEPRSPDVFFALARAYARAGRGEDAGRANARFLELNLASQSAKSP